MATVAATIEQRINDTFSVLHINLENESHQHSGPATESHFKLTLVSNDFDGVMRVKRHQKVYQLMADLMANTVHALSLNLYTEEEWEKRGGKVEPSPACRGLGE